jgi:hypothetical protein
LGLLPYRVPTVPTQIPWLKVPRGLKYRFYNSIALHTLMI